MPQKLPVTGYHRAINIACLILLAGTFILLAVLWRALPDQIPAHYNAAGEVDRWGGKGELLLCPVVAAVLYLFISVLERFPQAWNTGVKVTEANRAAVFRELKNLIVTVKLMMVLTFVFITACSALAQPLPGWFLPVDLVLIFGPAAFFLIRLFRLSRAQ